MHKSVKDESSDQLRIEVRCKSTGKDFFFAHVKLHFLKLRSELCDQLKFPLECCVNLGDVLIQIRSWLLEKKNGGHFHLTQLHLLLEVRTMCCENFILLAAEAVDQMRMNCLDLRRAFFLFSHGLFIVVQVLTMGSHNRCDIHII